MIDRLEKLLRMIVPDLSGLPLYIIDAADMVSRELLVGAPRGFWASDLAVKSHLLARDRWAGRGPAMVLDLDLIAADVQEFAPGDLRRLIQAVLGIGLHEMAHGLQLPFDLHEPNDYAECEQQQHVAELLSTAAAELWARFPPDLPKCVAHELPFIRAALHLHYRAEQADAKILPECVVDATQYELSSTDNYRRALGDEPQRMADETFAIIRDTTPPRAFAKLWCDDVRQTFLPDRNVSSRAAKYFIDELIRWVPASKGE